MFFDAPTSHPLEDLTVTATPIESSTPWDWLLYVFGYNSTYVDVENTELNGTTGFDGAIDFIMVGSVQYEVAVTDAGRGIDETFKLYPMQTEYSIWIDTTTALNYSAYPTFELWATDINSSYVRVGVNYTDEAGNTSYLRFYVENTADNSTVYSHNTGSPTDLTDYYDLENVKGEMYIFGFNASHEEFGNISKIQGITLKGDGLIVDLGFEDRSWYYWLSLGLLTLIAAIFSAQNVKIGVIIVPMVAGGWFWFLGWMPVTAAIPLGVAGSLGILLYMRKSESKLRY